MANARRIFLISGAAVGGGLLLGVGGIAAHLLTHDRLAVQRGAAASGSQVNLWLRITPDNHVVVLNPHTDMGQGSSTGLMQIVAEELDVDWSQIHTEQAPPDTEFSNGKVFEGFVSEMITPPAWAASLFENGFYRLGDLMKAQMTGGSSAVRFTGWDAMRKASAAARQMLITAAAAKLNVPAASLTTESGQVLHADSGRTLTYGELAADAALLASPENVVMKSAAERRLVGKSQPREDIPDKVFAKTPYGIDAEVPGMHYAAVVPSGVFGAKVTSIDNADEIKKRRGVTDVLITPESVAVVADNPWRAEQAVRAVRFTREANKNDTLSTESALQQQRDALAGDLVEGLELGEPGEAQATIKAEYLVPYLAHAALEPLSATVWQEDGKVHVIAGLQNPLMARGRVAEAAGVDFEDVVLHGQPMGGGFGRRVTFSMSGDEPLNWLVQAVQIAIDSGKPVKTIWSRETDTRSDVYRPMVLAQFEGALDDKGMPTLWRSRNYGKEMNVKAVAPPYDIANQQVMFADQPHPIPTGFWRSVEHSQHGFFVESFIDEMATAAGKDPLQFRLDSVASNSAHAAVLRKVAEMSSWRSGADAVDGQGRALGVAVVHSFGSTVAQVVEASIEGGQPRVHRVWCAVDCGIAVNPQAIEAQVQGSVNYALSAALYGKCDLKDGAVVQSNFHDYRVMQMFNAPRIEVELVKTDSPIGGVGEIGVPPLAPALCNALFVIDQKRRRTLPLV